MINVKNEDSIRADINLSAVKSLIDRSRRVLALMELDLAGYHSGIPSAVTYADCEHLRRSIALVSSAFNQEKST